MTWNRASSDRASERSFRPIIAGVLALALILLGGGYYWMTFVRPEASHATVEDGPDSEVVDANSSAAPTETSANTRQSSTAEAPKEERKPPSDGPMPQGLTPNEALEAQPVGVSATDNNSSMNAGQEVDAQESSTSTRPVAQPRKVRRRVTREDDRSSAPATSPRTMPDGITDFGGRR